MPRRRCLNRVNYSRHVEFEITFIGSQCDILTDNELALFDFVLGSEKNMLSPMYQLTLEPQRDSMAQTAHEKPVQSSNRRSLALD